MLISLQEIGEIALMTVAIGFIFSRFLRREHLTEYDPVKHFKKNSLMEDLKWGIIVAAPAVVLHELSHKFTAMAFGAEATIHAPLGWYAIVVLLQLLNFPFLFFVGGYVRHTPLPPFPSFLVAISGPLMNLAIYLALKFAVDRKLVHRRYRSAMMMAGRINMFLFWFNLIPFPGFDGGNALFSLANLIF